MRAMTGHDEISTSDAKLRKAIYIAFDGKCFYTGRDVAFEDMHIDHVRPRSRGGRDCVSNYVLTCRDINLKKGARHSEKFDDVVRELLDLIYTPRVLAVLDDLQQGGLDHVYVSPKLLRQIQGPAPRRKAERKEKRKPRLPIIRPLPVSVAELESFRQLAGVRKQDIPVMAGNSPASTSLGTKWFKEGAPASARPAMQQYYRLVLLKEGGTAALALPGVLDARPQEWEDG